MKKLEQTEKKLKTNAKSNYNARNHNDIETYNEIFIERIKLAREAKGLTQKEAAKELNININTLQNYEQGKGNRRDVPFWIHSFTEAYDVSSDYLIGNSDTPHSEYEDLIKTLGLNAEVIQQLQYLNEQDNAYSSRIYLNFINSFLGNTTSTSIFFEGLIPLLQNLHKVRDLKDKSAIAYLELSNYISDYIAKVVLPTYVQLHHNDTYNAVNPEFYLRDNSQIKEYTELIFD